MLNGPIAGEKSMTIEIHNYTYYFLTIHVPHQSCFLLYKCRIGEVIFTWRCFHDGMSIWVVPNPMNYIKHLSQRECFDSGTETPIESVEKSIIKSKLKEWILMNFFKRKEVKRHGKIWSQSTPAASRQLSWAASSEFGTYRLCEQRRFRRACAFAQSRQNLRCSLIQAVSQEEPSDRKPNPKPLWMAGHAQLQFVMTECSKTQIRLTGLSLLIL